MVAACGRAKEDGEIGKLTFVGTGILAAGQTTPQARGYIEDADKLFLVVADPVTRLWLESLNPTAESLTDGYREGKSRKTTYRDMVTRVLEPVRRDLKVCAAFYGHPGVFAEASHTAIRQARREGHHARMLPAISAEDCLFADLCVNPGAEGCQSFEATDFLLRSRKFDPASVLVLWQIGAIGILDFRREPLWSRAGLRVLMEVLMEHYPIDHRVVVYEAAVSPLHGPAILDVRLDELFEADVTVASTLYVPPRERAPLDLAMLDRLGLPHPTQDGAGPSS